MAASGVFWELSPEWTLDWSPKQEDCGKVHTSVCHGCAHGDR